MRARGFAAAVSRASAWLGRALLDPSDWERVGAPALDDARFEADRGALAFARGLVGFFVASFLAFASRRARSVLCRPWPGLLPVAAATTAGVVVLHASERPGLALAQLGFLVVGASIALAVGTCRGDTLRRAAPRAGGLVALAWLGTALFGVAEGGASRWLAVGPLFVHVSVLTWPWLLAGAAVTAARGERRRGTLLVALGLGALALQGDASGVLVLGVAVAACAWVGGERRLAAGWLLLGGTAATASGLMAVELPLVVEADGAWQGAMEVGLPLVLVGVLASVAVAWAPRRALRRAPEAAARAFGAGASVALAGFCVRPLLGGRDAVFFLGTGGSAVVGALFVTALAAAWAGEAAASDGAVRPATAGPPA